jgi:hypothetical protein
MPRFYVQIPIVGFVGVEVDALTEAAAIDEVMMSDLTLDDIEEWDVVKNITDFTYVPVKSAWAEDLGEWDEEI